MTAIDDFLNKLIGEQKAALERIRHIVRETVPEAEEAISYGMPAFKYQGKYLVSFSAYKNHLSLFPTSAPIDALREKLGDFKLSTGTIQFTLETPIPEDIIVELVSIRLANICGEHTRGK